MSLTLWLDTGHAKRIAGNSGLAGLLAYSPAEDILHLAIRPVRAPAGTVVQLFSETGVPSTLRDRDPGFEREFSQLERGSYLHQSRWTGRILFPNTGSDSAE